jgi:hypothetical protein
MPAIIETVPNPKKFREMPVGALVSSEIVKILQDLPEGMCVTLLSNAHHLLPDTHHAKDVERQRLLWSIAARRADISVITRSALTDKGEKAARIWRTDYP